MGLYEAAQAYRTYGNPLAFQKECELIEGRISWVLVRAGAIVKELRSIAASPQQLFIHPPRRDFLHADDMKKLGLLDYPTLHRQAHVAAARGSIVIRHRAQQYALALNPLLPVYGWGVERIASDIAAAISAGEPRSPGLILEGVLGVALVGLTINAFSHNPFTTVAGDLEGRIAIVEETFEKLTSRSP